MTLLTWLPAALLFAVPFGFAGLILGALLSDPRLPARLIYGADLLGSALGALIVIPAIRHLGVEKSLALCAAVTLAGLLAAARPRRTADPRAVGRGRRRHRARRRAAGRRLPDQGAFRLACSRAGRSDGYGIEYVQWDPVARIEISRIPPPQPDRSLYPLLIGDQAPFLARFKRDAHPERLRLLLHGGVRRPAGIAGGHRRHHLRRGLPGDLGAAAAGGRDRRRRRVRPADRAVLRRLARDRRGGERRHPRHPAAGVRRLLPRLGRPIPG